MLKNARMWVTGDNVHRIKDVKDYVKKLEDMIEAIEDHQRSFSCRSEYIHHFIPVPVCTHCCPQPRE